MFKLSTRVQSLSSSLTFAITAKAKALRQEGYDVIDLGVGEPDFNTADHILQAAKEAMDAGYTRYTPAGGISELKQAIIDKLQRDHGLHFKVNQVTVTVGAKHALYNVFQVLLDEGDQVIIPAPYWISYIEQVKLAGGIPVIITGEEAHQFKVTPVQLERAITARTKAVMINSPSNPTGMVYSAEELHALGEVCIQKDLVIISDEIYEKFLYGQEEQNVSIASLGPPFYQRTVIINGVSKTYAMTGWRIGFAAGPAEIITAMTNLASHSTSNPTSISQYAAIAALNGTQHPVERMKQAFKERRDYVMERLHQIPGFQCQTPPGAFYAFVNIAQAFHETYRDATEWAEALLEKEYVAVIPGSAFGFPDHIRISYAAPMENLQKALYRIERFVREQSARHTFS
jgi:aspartate aminotransferase